MMKMTKLGKLALSFSMGLTLLAGCGGSGGTTSGGEVTINLGSEPPEMNSFLNTDSTSGNVLRHVIVGLTTLDENDKAVPGVAESWTKSEDGLTYTFKLRADAKWNNGDPVTANDFVFAWNQLFTTRNGADYASTWAVMFEGADELMAATLPLKDDASEEQKAAAKEAEEAALANVGWKALDETTLEVKFTGPYPYVESVLAFYNLAPISEKLYNEYGGIETYGKEADKMAYNGPYTVTQWVHEDSLVMEKNPNYWDASSISIDKINCRMIKDTGAALNEFENGTIDMIGLNGEQAKNYRAEGKNVQSYDDGSVWYLEFNTQRPGMKNAKVRKALTLGVDVEKYVANVVLNESKPAQSFTAAAVNNGEFSNKVGTVWNRNTTDYSEAKKLLEEGLKEEGLTLETFKPTLVGDVGDTGKKTYQFVQEQLKTNLGVTMEIDQVEFKTRLQRMSDGDFDIVWAGWSCDYDDPMSYLDLWITGGGNNHGKWSNAEYDALIKAAYSEGDVEKRTQQLLDAEKIIGEEVPIGPMYYRQRDFICSDKLVGVQRTAFRDIDLRFASVK